MTSEGNFVQSGINGNFVQSAIPRFNGHYDHWSMLMENFLRSKEYWSLVETGYVEPENGATLTNAQQKKLEEEKLKDLKVKNYLFQAIDRTILETILQKDTSKQIWDSMKRKYEGNERYECPSWDKETNYAELGEEEEMMLMSYVEMNEAKREDVWFLDSGCSNHMCGDKTFFYDLNKNFRQMVKLGNNSRMTMMGKGNVRMKVNGLTHVNVYLVGCITTKYANLLSYSYTRLVTPLALQSYEEQVVALLEWRDNDEEAIVSEDGDIAEEVENVSPDTVDEGKIRRQPVWMNDYETGEGLSEEENEANMAFFDS
ncbi:hypothetical protein JRO89_XS13G0167200 [Xanthoceras sorbifolium]|uniref:Retrovirus-related Pol polyprotein from transposon TNT 1-94-like beta-barrel domain-containing protein n=1 Tax=Xanthoceras sorbifolium TaxID=99658 RepID=A0ABQ8H8N8_9ROSI|nr:hypothetical protein JRO89_XS13G0167200 [Xanthoceras sorbifolium]